MPVDNAEKFSEINLFIMLSAFTNSISTAFIVVKS